MEYERMADLTFSEIKQAFYFSQISWENIPLKKETPSFRFGRSSPPLPPNFFGKAHRYIVSMEVKRGEAIKASIDF